MSGGSSSLSKRRRLLANLDGELEEGEYGPGYQSSSDTEDYYNRDSSDSDKTISDLDATATSAAASQPNRKGNNASASSAEAIRLGGARAYSAAAANHYGRGGSPSSFAAVNPYGRASASPAAPMFPCSVCEKEFASKKARCGHMKAHAQEAVRGGKAEVKGKGIKKVNKRSVVEVPRAWTVTGRRGFSGLAARAVSPNADPDRSTGDAPAERKLVYQPTTPVALALPNGSSSASTLASARNSVSNGERSSKKQIHNGDMDIAQPGAGANLPIPPAHNNDLLDIAEEEQQQEQEAGANNPVPPAHNDGMDIAEAAGANPSPPAEPSVRHQAAPQPAGKQAKIVHKRTFDPDGHMCGYPECGKWFASNQALGGHVAGHKAKELAAAAAETNRDGAGTGPPSSEEKLHKCKECEKAFVKGVQLGGHMRKHRPIESKNKRRLVQPLPPPPEVAAGPAHHDTLSQPNKVESPALAPAVDASSQPALAAAAAAEVGPEPATEPLMTRPVIIFGVDIAMEVQTPPAQERSPATKDSSASTGEQQ